MRKHEPTTVEGLVESARGGKISRRRLMVALSSLGVTAAGAAAIAATLKARASGASKHVQQLQQHDQHVAHQTRGDIQHMANDYHEDAVVEDPLFDQPFVGRDAISRRFSAEVASVPDRALRINNRFFVGDELIVEWQATGTHSGDFLGFGGTGRPYTLSGVTVVTRRDGKIVRESHYYDVASLRSQVESSAM